MVSVNRLFLLVSWVVFSAVVAAPSTGWGQGNSDPLSEREKVIHVLNRFGYGHSPGTFEQVLEEGAEAWLKEQLEGGIPVNPILADSLEGFETLRLTPSQPSASRR